MRNAVVLILVTAMAGVLWWQSRDPVRPSPADRAQHARKTLELPAEQPELRAATREPSLSPPPTPWPQPLK